MTGDRVLATPQWTTTPLRHVRASFIVRGSPIEAVTGMRSTSFAWSSAPSVPGTRFERIAHGVGILWQHDAGRY
jgi:hypothetical protein